MALRDINNEVASGLPHTSGTPAPARATHWMERRVVRIGAPLVVLVLLGLFLRNLGLREVAQAVTNANPGWIALAVVLTIAGVVCRAVALQSFTSPTGRMPLSRAVRYTFAGITGNIVAPLRAGDGLRAWLLVKHQNLTLGGCAAVFFCEKLGDLLSFGLLAAPVPWLLDKLPPWAPWALATPCVLAALCFGILVIAKKAPFMAAARRRIGPIGTARSLVPGLVAVFGASALDLLEIMVSLRAVGVPAGYAVALLVLIAINLAITIPAPANGGTLELGAVIALNAVGVDRGRALAFALLYHAAQVLPVLMIGISGGALAWRSTFRAEAEADVETEVT